MNCLYCAAGISNGLTLDDLCQRKVTVDLEFLPIYFRNLARWRPGRAGARPVPGSRVLYDGAPRAAHDRIGDALDEAGSTLSKWAQKLNGEPPTGDTEADQAVALCAWFTEHIPTIATLDWAGEFLHEIDHHEAILRRLTEESIPGWYAGQCARKVTMEATCGAGTYVVPGLTWVTCGQCGTTTYARDHLPVILNEARDWIAAPKQLAEAIVALTDEKSIDDLRKRIAIWGTRDRIATIRKTEYAEKTYRLGDVLDIVTAKRIAA